MEYLEDAERLEREEGTIELLKVALSALNKILIAKGLLTKEELQKSFRQELKGE